MSIPQKLHGFVLQDTHEYKNSGFTGYLYQNEKFKCPFLYIRTDDTNNFFSVHFRTPEEDNTGISHMLEHLSLHGSEKYPIRRVFFELNKRSYSTFMNAFTASEFTVYPFGSTNQTDFLNDLDVYLDCVFHPKLSKVTFLSECHHLLFEDGDSNKPLIHGGVIYNEVVGSYSKQPVIFHQKVMENLYPDSPSRFDCGGTPSDIPKATYENVVHHHKQYYHPVNSFFYFYGNSSFPIDIIFQKISEVIDKFDVIESPYHPELYEMKPWSEPRKVIIDAPADEKTPLEDQHQTTITYVIDEKVSNDRLMCNLDFLVEILGQTNNSPLYQKLVLPGHVKGIVMALQPNKLYPTISITATGFLKEKTEEIEQMITDVFKNFVEETSEKVEQEILERLDCSYHSAKLSNKKVPDNLGLVLFNCFAEQWIHGANPLLLIDFDANLEVSYSDCKQPGFLKALCKRYLVDNNHCLFARLNPVPDYNDKLIEEEKKNLEEYKKSLTKDQIQEILDNMLKITEEQQEPQPIHLLPQIHRSDLSKLSDFKSVDETYNDMIDIFLNPTNGVVYAHVIVTADKCDIPNIWLLPLMNALNGSVGAGRFTEYELSMYTQRWVSSLTAHATINDALDGTKKPQLTIICASLDEDVDKLRDLMEIVSTETHWNNIEKVEIVVNQFRNFVGKLIVQAMDSINSVRAECLLNDETAIGEAVNGLTGFNNFYEFLTTKTVQEISDACETLYKQILTNGKIRGYIACSKEMKETAISAVESVIHKIQSVPKIEYTPFDYSKEVFEKVQKKKTFINIPIPTGAVALKKFCVKIDQLKASVCLTVVATILTNEALLDQVREKFGAYSASALFIPRTGVFTISTYRDSVPHKTYEKILEIIANINDYITDESVERAVVSFLSKTDTPQAPPTKGVDWDIAEITREYLQKRRDIYLSLTTDDVKEAAKYLTDGEFNVSIATSLSITEPPEGFQVFEI